MGKVCSMQANALLEAALQLKGSGWRVVGSSFGGKPAQMKIVLEHDRIALRCPACAGQCPGYDAVEKRWRHLNFFQYRCELVAKVPRGGVPAPWGADE